MSLNFSAYMIVVIGEKISIWGDRRPREQEREMVDRASPYLALAVALRMLYIQTDLEGLRMAPSCVTTWKEILLNGKHNQYLR